jgi:tetratricopeptide (TPR) repeat protein
VRARTLSLLSLATALALAGGGCVTVPSKGSGYNAGATNSPLNPNGTAFSRFWKTQSNKIAAFANPSPAKAKSAGPDAEFFVTMGRAEEQNGNLAKAEDFYRKALANDPKSLMALTAYAHFEDRRDHLEAATKLYKRAIAKHPQEAGVYNDLALCYQRRGLLDESTAMLWKATRLQPKRPLFHNNLAAVLVDAGRSDEALAELLTTNSEAVAHYNLACLLHRKGDDTLAVNHFRQAVAFDANMVPAQQWLAKLSPGESPADERASLVAQRLTKSLKTGGLPSGPSTSSSDIDTMASGEPDAGAQRIPAQTVGRQTLRQTSATVIPADEGAVAPLPEPPHPRAVAKAPPVAYAPPVASRSVGKAVASQAHSETAENEAGRSDAAASDAIGRDTAAGEVTGGGMASSEVTNRETTGNEVAGNQEMPEATIPLGQTFAHETSLSVSAVGESGETEETEPVEESTVAAAPGRDGVGMNQSPVQYPHESGHSNSPDGFEMLPAPLPDAAPVPVVVRRPASLPNEIEPLPATSSASDSSE